MPLDPAALTPEERRLVARLRTPLAMQRWLQGIRYNKEEAGRTLRSFRGVQRHGTAHCLEGALAAAVVLEHHGHPPLLLDLESADKLDHVVLTYRGPDGRWGAVGKSRYPALMGRKPVYRTVRDLAWSYVDPFVDRTGRVTAYALYDLRDLSGKDWRLDAGNVWRVERALIDHPHAPLKASRERHLRWKRAYHAWKATNPDHEPPLAFYPDHARFV